MDPLNINGYDVPLIPSGLRHEETIIQTANALEYLNNTINDIFDKIDNRINRNNEKIREMQNRICQANKKITNLVGSKKAICIYSPSKFPALDLLQDIPATFNSEVYKNIPFKLNTEYEIKSDFEPLTQNSLQDKLEFFHVKEHEEQSRMSKLSSGTVNLGSIPATLKSINSLYLYNTMQNVYAKQTEKGLFKMQQNAKTQDKTEIREKIEAPPISIARQIGTEKKITQKLFYTPKINEAPNINLPLDLPDLPGIANNIQFEIKKNNNSASSRFEQHLSLKNSKSEHSATQSSKPNDDVENTKANLENIRDKTDIDSDKKPINNTLQSSLNSAPPPPPPPPPPVASLITENVKVKNKIVKSEISQTTDSTDARSNLMEAIRKAGGARGGKLRAADDVTSTKTQDVSRNSKQSSNNLMDDLHKKLLMRRKGISGAKDEDRGSNVLDRLSSLIPPPPKPSQGMYSSTSDNENDNDDWD